MINDVNLKVLNVCLNSLIPTVCQLVHEHYRTGHVHSRACSKRSVILLQWCHSPYIVLGRIHYIYIHIDHLPWDQIRLPIFATFTNGFASDKHLWGPTRPNIHMDEYPSGYVPDEKQNFHWRWRQQEAR